MEERIVRNPMDLVRAAYFAGVHDGIGKGCEISGMDLPGDDMFDEFMESVEKDYLGNEVVRCRDCKFSTDHGFLCALFGSDNLFDVEPEGFCVCGRRKDNA